MKNLNRELVCHFKKKLLLRVIFSMGFYAESNLNAM